MLWELIVDKSLTIETDSKRVVDKTIKEYREGGHTVKVKNVTAGWHFRKKREVEENGDQQHG